MRGKKADSAGTELAEQEVIDMATQLLEEDKEKVDTARKGIARYREKHCTQLMPELRPTLFPEELWQHVMDSQKPLVEERWKRYEAPEVKEGRLQEVIKAVESVAISKENEGRILDLPLFKAQLYANVDRFGHPDPSNPPRIKDVEFHIRLEEGAAPFQNKPRRMSILERMCLAARVFLMLENKMIQRSESCWSSPVNLIPFPERINKFLEQYKGEATARLNDPTLRDVVATLYRLTGGYRQLSQLTVLESYPLPRIADILDRMKGKDRYSTGDIEDAFFTVAIHEASKKYTAFMTPDGNYEYNVMAQGLKNAANKFASIVGTIFEPLKAENFSVYQDDVANYESESVGAHLELQQKMYDILRENDMCLKASKTFLNFTTQRILGHIMSKHGRCPDPKAIEAITKLAMPLKTIGDVRAMVGLALVVREYVPALSDIIEPIQALLRKGVDIETEWKDKVHGQAFELLKKALVSTPVLMLPDLFKEFSVHIDACRVGRGLAAVLMQKGEDGLDHPVAYWSRGLQPAERNHSATELECTALHDAILHWRVYLQNGVPFQVVTDHYALVYMVTRVGGDPHHRLARLCMDLQGYTFSVVHRAGKDHLLPDAVSRLLQTHDIAYVNTEDDLREGFEPLQGDDLEWIKNKFGNESGYVIEVINEFRDTRNKEYATADEARLMMMRGKRADKMGEVTKKRRRRRKEPTKGNGKGPERLWKGCWMKSVFSRRKKSTLIYSSICTQRGRNRPPWGSMTVCRCISE